MTEALQDSLPPPPPPPPPSAPPNSGRRLARDPDDKVVAGVCAALGRFTDTDPILWRVLLAALVLFGGTGLALYALAWLLIPRKDQPTSFFERHLRHPDRTVSVAGVVLLLLLVVVLFSLLDNGSGLFVIIVVVGLAFLVTRERRTMGPGTPLVLGTIPAATWTATGAPSSYGVPPVGPSAFEVPPPPRPPRPRSALGSITLCAAALLAGVLLLFRELGATAITAPRVLAATMLVIAAGLLVGTWYGRARWLLAVGVVLALVLLPITLLHDQFSGGLGERTWTPDAATGTATGTASYRLGVGDAVLDLRQLEPGGTDSIRADVGVGRLVALVPDDLRVRIQTDVGLGEVVETGGGSLSRFDDPRNLEPGEVLQLGPTTGPELALTLQVGIGEIEVRYVRS